MNQSALYQFEKISEKVHIGQRLTEDDALFLFESATLAQVGALADGVNRRINGMRTFYNVNRHINPTNICALSCKFCAFSRKPGDEGAYAYTAEEMLEKARVAVEQGATEIHMVGGLHPRWSWKHYLDMIAAMHMAFPDVHLKAFTAVELDWMARRARKSIKEVLEDLKSVGLGSIPGGGAEIFHPEIRDQICDTKVSAEQWIETHRLAHSIGLRSNCTMLYGHIEKPYHRVDHMRRLRELQDETGGFNVFIPLAFQPFQNELGIQRYTCGADDLKTIAVARLYLDNFKNVKAYWVMLGQDIAQVALNFGANDLDGTVTEEKISRMAGGRAGMVMSRGDLELLIGRTGHVAVERDTLYKAIRPEEDRAALGVNHQKNAWWQEVETNEVEKPTLTFEWLAPGEKSSHRWDATLELWRPHDELSHHISEITLKALRHPTIPMHVRLSGVSHLKDYGFLTIVEYLQKVSRLRSELPDSVILGAHLDDVPTLSPAGKTAQGLTHKEHPTLKVLGVLAMCGIRDLGSMGDEVVSKVRLLEDISASGLNVLERKSLPGGLEVAKNWDRSSSQEIPSPH